jgi:hypothetical protein
MASARGLLQHNLISLAEKVDHAFTRQGILRRTQRAAKSASWQGFVSLVSSVPTIRTVIRSAPVRRTGSARVKPTVARRVMSATIEVPASAPGLSRCHPRCEPKRKHRQQSHCLHDIPRAELVKKASRTTGGCSKGQVHAMGKFGRLTIFVNAL